MEACFTFCTCISDRGCHTGLIINCNAITNLEQGQTANLIPTSEHVSFLLMHWLLPAIKCFQKQNECSHHTEGSAQHVTKNTVANLNLLGLHPAAQISDLFKCTDHTAVYLIKNSLPLGG